MHQGKRAAVVLAAFTAVVLLSAGSALGGVAGPGYAATDFVTGLADNGSVGPVGLAFDASNQLYVMDYANGVLYKFGASGGVAGAAGTVVGNLGVGGNNAAGITFSPSGRLYVALQAWGRIDEISPLDGHHIRTVAGGICSATGIATDPATGDLFAGFGCSGIVRIGGYETGPLTVQSLGIGGIDGITVGPDGSLYLAQFGSSVLRLTRTGPYTFGALVNLANVPTSDGTAVAPSLDPANPYVFANRNDGRVTKIDTTGGIPGTQTDIFTGGSRGDFSTVGPDGCLYITQTDRVVKITNADGTCSFIPTSALPQISLSPPAQSQHVGDTATVTATLTNIPAGTAVTITVTGANPQTTTAVAGSGGTLTFSYAGANTGDDEIAASATVGTQHPSSVPVTVHWLPPLDSTPPVITPTVSGPAGDNGWYTGDTTVSWTVTDPDSPVTSTTGCDPVTLVGYHAGETLTCSATSTGGTASASVTVKIDDTPPNVGFSPNGGVYDVNQTIDITCTATDAGGSGIASSTCANVSGTGWSLGVGTHTLSASATDNAGNTGTGSGSYTVVATADGVCALVQQWVSNAGIANSLCAKLRAAAASRARGQNGTADNQLAAFRNELSAQSGKALTAAHAAQLAALSYYL